jgi:hypothetical protein
VLPEPPELPAADPEPDPLDPLDPDAGLAEPEAGLTVIVPLPEGPTGPTNGSVALTVSSPALVNPGVLFVAFLPIVRLEPATVTVIGFAARFLNDTQSPFVTVTWESEKVSVPGDDAVFSAAPSFPETDDPAPVTPPSTPPSPLEEPVEDEPPGTPGVDDPPEDESEIVIVGVHEAAAVAGVAAKATPPAARARTAALGPTTRFITSPFVPTISAEPTFRPGESAGRGYCAFVGDNEAGAKR